MAGWRGTAAAHPSTAAGGGRAAARRAASLPPRGASSAAGSAPSWRASSPGSRAARPPTTARCARRAVRAAAQCGQRGAGGGGTHVSRTSPIHAVSAGLSDSSPNASPKVSDAVGGGDGVVSGSGSCAAAPMSISSTSRSCWSAAAVIPALPLCAATPAGPASTLPHLYLTHPVHAQRLPPQPNPAPHPPSEPGAGATLAPATPLKPYSVWECRLSPLCRWALCGFMGVSLR